MRILVTTFLVVNAFIASANACSCIWPDDITIEEDAASVDAIFKGKYLGSARSSTDGFSGPQRKGRFQVLEVLKGDLTDPAIVLFAKFNGANCGMRFKKSHYYEVFAYRDVQGNASTISCSSMREQGGVSNWAWEAYRKALEKE